jgi:hypothetical protein
MIGGQRATLEGLGQPNYQESWKKDGDYCLKKPVCIFIRHFPHLLISF